MEEKMRRPMILLLILAIAVVYFVAGGIKFTADPVALGLAMVAGIAVVIIFKRMEREK